MTIEEIQALLEKKFAGERKDGLRMLARTIAMTAGDTDDEKTKEKIEAMTAESVKDFIKEWRKDADAETTKSNQTAEPPFLLSLHKKKRTRLSPLFYCRVNYYSSSMFT